MVISGSAGSIAALLDRSIAPSEYPIGKRSAGVVDDQVGIWLDM